MLTLTAIVAAVQILGAIVLLIDRWCCRDNEQCEHPWSFKPLGAAAATRPQPGQPALRAPPDP